MVRTWGGRALATVLTFGLALPGWAQSSEGAPPGGEPPSDASYESLSLEQLLQVRVVSASQELESLSQAPVPVTVITAEMIRSSGVRNLKEALALFVPGMTAVEDQNELNVAMRGVFGSSQQKMLVMLDGHRLNSHVYSSANPDFSIGLDKVKQIEVLRGPASSLYGNVALTAVINIVTKTGSEVNGLVARAGVGNFGQRTGSILYGLGFGDGKGDLLIWGNMYRSGGEAVAVPADQDFSGTPVAGTAIVGAENTPPSFDVGAKVKYGNFTLMLNRRFGKHTSPFSDIGTTGEVYDPSQYRTFETIGVGLGQYYDHLDLKYDREINDAVSIEASVYYDDSQLRSIGVSSPATRSGLFLAWDDQAVGGIAQVRWAYHTGRFGSGTLMVGSQVEGIRMLDSIEPSATGGEWKGFGDSSQKPLIQPGSEVTYAGFAQVKHEFKSWLVFNGGARFDFKQRHLGAPIHDISPRVALMYIPSERFDLKLSYSQSFVDAPYWYRYNSLPSYRGSDNLKPEHLRSLQVTPTITAMGGKFKNTLNLFYNDLYDFIFRDNAAVAPAPFYRNAGTLQTFGAEEEVAWVATRYHLRANATYQYLLDDKDYPVDEAHHRIDNVPSLVANLIVDVNPFFKWTDKVWLNASVHYSGKQASPIVLTFKDAAGNPVKFNEPDNVVDQSALVNLGAHITDLGVSGLSVDATVYNLLGTRTEQGGSTVHPYPQQGRWFLASLTYHLNPDF